jgi:hypothetical protein
MKLPIASVFKHWKIAEYCAEHCIFLKEFEPYGTKYLKRKDLLVK